MAIQLVNDGLDQRLVDVRRVADGVHLARSTTRNDDVTINENRRNERACRSDESHPVERRIGVEIPHARTGHAALDDVSGNRDVFRRVRAAGIPRHARHVLDGCTEKVDEIQRVRAPVEQQAAATDGGIETPGTRGVAVREGIEQLDVNRRELADRILPQKVAHQQKPRQGAAVERHPQRHSALTKRRDHAQALRVGERHGFLDETRLAGCRDA